MARKRKGAAAPDAGARLLQGVQKVVPIDSVRPHPENARRGDVPAIKESILATGFYGRLTVWKRNDLILIGNNRWAAAKELGMTEIPVEVVDVDEATARRMLAADNRTSDLAGYDEKARVALLKQIRAEATLEGTGYSDKDLDALVKKISTPAPPDQFGTLDPGGMHLARTCPRCAFQF